MSSSVTATAGNITVVVHVHPTPAQVQRNARFNWGQPVALGSVQIMVGVVVLLFGIPMSLHRGGLAVYSGVYFWGGLTYIIAGSLTVAASKSMEHCLLNGSMAVNITSAVFSFAGVIICSLDDVFSWDYYYAVKGFPALLAIFQFLQFAISVTLAGFACHATCGCGQEPPPPNSEAPPTSQGNSQVSTEMVNLTKPQRNRRPLMFLRPTKFIDPSV
ncbi:membrane-spanning 4-domains subfamily A member 15-like [Salarias fasciatus]|uniref:membrane-spanning 4-domains subfamily A member 15-like n=1 Tax=Salarias fasciatus TaxID=181472 RepID=UPI0011768EC6|nr:membrane-spanning 4-domains subfamily A member 15-like [Salarias fasciatus]